MSLVRRGRVAVIIAALVLASCSPRELQVSLVESTTSVPAHVRVDGLSSSDLADLRAVEWNDADWQALLKVAVSGSDDIPIVGRYVPTGAALEFHPRFPLDPGRRYAVEFSPGRLPTPRKTPLIGVALALPGESPSPSTKITGIYPSSRVWPANLLRFYLHFSGPMSNTTGVGRVRLLGEDGKEVEDALLPLEADLWNDEFTRYTVFFDPGRVKRGILPNRQMGRPLETGRHYAIVVTDDWPDAHGQALTERFRHDFKVAEAIEQPLKLADWRIAAPASGSRDPLVVRFPAPLDYALLNRAIGVAADGGSPLAGTIAIADEEREWRFTPAAAWTPGRHDLLVISVLEDPSGNRVDRAFEVVAADDRETERHTVSFAIK